MNVRLWLRPACAGALLLVGGVAGAVPARAPTLALLDKVEHGQWLLRETGGSTRTLCLTDPDALLQVRHGGAQCSRFVIAEAADRATVHYTCPGQGHGRTTIVVETPRLVRIETQGVADGAPFELELEGRRSGMCAPQPATH